MNQTEQTELTVLCLLSRGDEILLQNRRKADWHGYTLPGGHVEAGESIVDAVVREMQEETGLTVHAPKLCGIKQFPIEGGRYLVFLFKASSFSGQLRSSAEGEMRWVTRSELPALPLVNDFAALLKVMESDSLTEFIYTVQNGSWLVSTR